MTGNIVDFVTDRDKAILPHVFRERYTDWTGDGEWKRKRR